MENRFVNRYTPAVFVMHCKGIPQRFRERRGRVTSGILRQRRGQREMQKMQKNERLRIRWSIKDRHLLWKINRTRKDGSWSSEEARQKWAHASEMLAEEGLLTTTNLCVNDDCPWFAKRKRLVEHMECFLRVITSIPGIDNHDANAVP
ncbi:hypothetical protein IEQ34_000497 [Dendrobium chrysotoxum]|uniref:Uncharacterized protein n=1 Tax=Dendrobium chrysotoxum TaxID=161865 RepID=A0AAV7HAF1_DENCH|nr:hypothetical protein IEQ34_000497 [Dendrobium chrysotoxum]